MTYEPSTFDSSITSESDLYTSYVKDSEGFVVSDYESELYGGEREIWERKLKTVENAFEETKRKLYYSTHDQLEETALNVGPQHNLEGQIDVHCSQIRKTISSASSVGDIIPQKVLDKVDSVTKIARDGKASTFSASENLTNTKLAFDYGRKAALNQFDLLKKTPDILNEYDETFVSMLQSQLDVEMDDAEATMKNCLHLLEQAIKEAKDDQIRLQQQTREESSSVTMETLTDIHVEAQQELLGEEEEFETIQNNCKQDTITIDKCLDELKKEVISAQELYNKRKGERADVLQRNRKEQAELRRRLRQLEEEEREYEKVNEEEEELQVLANSGHVKAQENIIEWKKEIVTLEKQAETSLTIMQHMAECTDNILTDAKQRKKEWEEKLFRMEIENLLHQRDALIAIACIHKMEADDCQENMKDTRANIDKVNRKMDKAAQRKFKEEVEELKIKKQRQEDNLKTYKDKIDDHNIKVSEAEKELSIVDSKIKSLKSDIRLENIETIYRERERIKKMVFEKKKVDEARKLHSCNQYDIS